MSNPMNFIKHDVNHHEKPSSQRKTPWYLMLLLSGAVCLTICVAITLGIYSKLTTKIFVKSISNNLESYSSGQAAVVDAKIDDIINTLSAFSTLIQQKNDKDFIDTYITALNENAPETTFLFTTAEEFDRRVKTGEAGALDIEYMNRLEKGEVIVSDIGLSELAGNIYCFSIGVPVFSDGNYIGGLRAIVNADILVESNHYLSPYGKIENTYIIDSNGKLLFSSVPYTDKVSLSEEALLKMQQEFFGGSANSSFYLQEMNGVPYYASIFSLNYNNWKSVVIFRAGETKGIMSSLFQYTVISALMLMLATMVICVALTIYFKRWMTKINEDTERYLLLEQFSDTVLFDYDKINDIIRFTPNAQQLFQVHEGTHKRFSANLEQIENIHPTDCAVIKRVLAGQAQYERNELRIRLKHPSDGFFYWYLIQYKYIHNKEKVISIIGKIVNIDEQQRYEESLVKQTMTDGLTELYNKSASEYLIKQCLEEDKAGLFFMIDIDNLKQINDTHGHPKGDYVIQSISRCLKGAFRLNDIIGRIGGDELLVYMREVSAPSLVHKKIKILGEQLQEYSKQSAVELTVSIGVVSFPNDGQSFEELYKQADKQMYQAKQNGKQQYCFKNQIFQFNNKLQHNVNIC